mmetsp:Transcript_72521/g.169940  ORF Transcript_72521/g.169940 Transcript_72521/m.169940 type:complete len:376 (-) Transcript_72521:51-1178(-)
MEVLLITRRPLRTVSLQPPLTDAQGRGISLVRSLQRKVRRNHSRLQLGSLGRREAAIVAACAAAALPAASRAGPFVELLSDVLPVRQAQRMFARFDWEIRDGVNRVTEIVASPTKPPEVPDATGAEEAFRAAGDFAAAAANLDRQRLALREMQLREQEPSRLRGRAEAGLFETEMLGSVTSHMASNLDKPAFKAYCAWKAIAEAMKDVDAAHSSMFRKVFGRQLLDGRLGAFPPPPVIKASPDQAVNLVSQIQAALAALTEAGLCSKATLQVDEVLVEVWGEGGSEELVLPALIEGDPLVDAQLLLSEELAPPVLPDPILAAMVVWLEEARGPGYASLQTYYVNSRWRGRTEYSNMVYVPKQRLFQLTLHRSPPT